MRRPWSRFRVRPARRRDGASGSIAIEFALCGPLLLLLLLAVAEIGYTMYQAMQVYSAVEAGALFASRHDWDPAGIAAAVANATGTPGVSATPAPVQFCGCAGAAGVAETACTATCSGGGPAAPYARINASLTRQGIFPSTGWPLPDVLTAQSIVRLK